MASILSEDVARVKAVTDCREVFERFWPERIKRRSGSAWMALCPFHEDRNPSLAIKKSQAKCFAGCTPVSGNSVFDCFDLVVAATGKSFPESVRLLAEAASIELEKSTPGPAKTNPPRSGSDRSQLSHSSGEVVATYDYVDESGIFLFQVVRLEPKSFRQRRRGKAGEWIWSLDGVRRVLYRLPEVTAAQSVVICEGEKDVDNLRPHLPPDWAATTAPGGAGKWSSDYTHVLSGKDVVVIPDIDNPGLAHLDLLTAELRRSVRSFRVAFLDNLTSLSASAKDISDYLNTLSTDEERAQAVSSLLGSSASVALEESELEDESSDPLERIPLYPFPWDILPETWLNHFHDLSESLAGAPEGVVSCALAILSGAIGNQVKVSPKPGWKTSVAIWMALVGDSGQGKTPIIQSLMQGLYDLQQKAYDAYQKEMENWEANALKKGDDPLPPPKLIRYFTTDPTIEALLLLLAENPHGVILVKDELASLVCGFNQYKPGGRGNERQHYLSIFSGSPVVPDRKSSEKIYVRHPFLSLLGGVQRRLIPEVLGSDAFNDGLIYRFLFLVLDPKWYPLSRKSWREESRDAWRRLLMMARGLDDERIVHLDNEAWDCFRSFRDRLYELFGYLPAPIAGFIPKMAEYALRLAGILHVWHAFPSLPPSAFLSGEIMDKAVRLTAFYFGQARLLQQLYQKRRELRSDQQILLSILHDSEAMVAGGALPTFFLFEAFNSRVPTNIQLPNTRKLTALIKELAGLADVTLTFRPMRWHSTYCRCLVWEADKIAKLLKFLPST